MDDAAELEEEEKRKILYPPALLLLRLLLRPVSAVTVDAQYPIPRKIDGLVYEGRYPGPDSIVDAFLDPVCPDSRDSRPPLKKALSHYSGRVALFVHPFALPSQLSLRVSKYGLRISDLYD
ncbi:hypothetical protein ACLOJK_008884 [Asimina triloba]